MHVVIRCAVLFVAFLGLLRPSEALAGNFPGNAPDAVVRPLVLGGNDIVSLQAPRLMTYIPLGPRPLRRGDVWLELDLEASPTLDTEQTRISVFLDQIPLGTWSLADLRGAGSVKLGDPPAGYHSLTFDAQLVVQDEECNEDRSREAWIRFTNDSRITWSSSLEGKVGVQDLVREWTARGQVGLAPSRFTSPSEVIAYLHARELLAKWNVNAVADVSRGSLKLRVDPRADLVEVRAERGSLLVTARSEELLAEALFEMKSDRFLPSCAEVSCLLSTSQKAASVGHATPAVEASSETTVSISEQYPSGWEIGASGSRVFRFAWRRPPHWVVRRGAQFELQVQLAEEAKDRNPRVHLSLHLNDVPVDRWILSHRADSETGPAILRATIPERLVGAEVWNFEVRASVTGIDEDRCTGGSVHLPVAHIGLESGLRIPHARTVGDAIVDWSVALDARPELEFEGTLSVQAFEGLSALLEPLGSRFPHEPWRLAGARDDGARTEHTRVTIRNIPDAASSFEVVRGRGRSLLHVRAPRAGLALIPLENAFALERRGEQLVVLLGESPLEDASGGFARADLDQFGAPIATRLREGWIPVGVRKVTESTEVSPPDSPRQGRAIMSEGATKYALTNLIWGISSASLLGGLLIWFRKQARVR